MNFKVKNEKIKEHSRCYKEWHKYIRTLKKGSYLTEDKFIGGDAPKCLLRIYNYDGKQRKDNHKTWPLYIAKFGQKKYPIESITEYLIARIGETLKLKMAVPGLVFVDGQIRFLSKYFLNKNERLEHGAQIIGSYINDQNIIEEIAKERVERDLFTFQIILTAFTKRYGNDCEEITNEFVKMLAFDALIGINDRHPYNWGVVTNVKNNNLPSYFSPIYDSARGLFWDNSDKKLN